MNTSMFYALGGFLLLLAGLLYLTFVTWLIFWRSLAKMPNSDALLDRAPKVMEAFDAKTWGSMLLPWQIIERLVRWLMSRLSGNQALNFAEPSAGSSTNAPAPVPDSQPLDPPTPPSS
ncbi:hypothetical protein [Plantactinospora sp. DSM 117369]